MFLPKKEYRNGREYRDYTEEDVRTLLVVASLRRAWFTMEEIRRMQQDPAAIGEILPQYRQWLHAQKRQLDGLIAAADKLTGQDIHSVAELSARMAEETRKLPLPQMDITPRFKYIDELEERLPLEPDEQAEAEKRRRQDQAWVYRRMDLNLSRTQFFDFNLPLRQLRETQELTKPQKEDPMQSVFQEQEPRWLRWGKGLLTLTAALFAVMCMVSLLGGMFSLRLWVLFLTTAGARLLWAYLGH